MSAVGAGLRTEDSPDLARRVLALALVLLAIVVVAALLFRGDGGYTVTTADCAAGTIVAVGSVDSNEGAAATSNSVTLTCAVTAVTLGDMGTNAPSSRAPLAAIALVGVSLVAGLLWRRRRS